MALGIENDYGYFTMQGLSGYSASGYIQNKEREKIPAIANNSNTKTKEQYVKELAKLVPSVEFKVGNTFSSLKIVKHWRSARHLWKKCGMIQSRRGKLKNCLRVLSL